MIKFTLISSVVLAVSIWLYFRVKSLKDKLKQRAAVVASQVAKIAQLRSDIAQLQSQQPIKQPKPVKVSSSAAKARKKRSRK